MTTERKQLNIDLYSLFNSDSEKSVHFIFRNEKVTYQCHVDQTYNSIHKWIINEDVEGVTFFLKYGSLTKTSITFSRFIFGKPVSVRIPFNEINLI